MPPPRTHTGPRYCRCGTRLAADNPGDRCQACVRRDQDHERHPPDLPPEFWHTDQLRDAFAAQHLGLVSVAYRRHPYHRRPITQDRLGSWLGITQAQVSRIESGPPVRNLDQLIFWARTMKIPPELLWFAMPGERRRTTTADGGSPGDRVTSGAGRTAIGHEGGEHEHERGQQLSALGLDGSPAAASSSRHLASAETGDASPAPHPAAAGPDGRSSVALSPGAPYEPSGAAQGQSPYASARPEQANHQADRDSGLVVPDHLAALLEQLAGTGNLPPAGLLSLGGTPPSLGSSAIFDLPLAMPNGPNLGVDGSQGQVIGRIGEVLVVAIDRRVFMVRASLALPSLVTETARQGLARDLLGDGYAGAEEWQAIVRQHYTRYGRTSPAEAFIRLSTDLAALRDAFGHERDEAAQNELRKAGALLTALTSEAAADLGDLPACERWAWTARRMADASGDLHTQLWVRGREVVLGLYQRRPLAELLDIAEEGIALGQAQGPPRTAAWPTLLGATAQALAVVGRQDEAVATLDQTRASFEAMPSERRDTARPGFIEDHMIFTEGYVYTYLGDYNQADTAWDATLRLHGPERKRSSAEVELMRSLCQVRAGDIPAGVAHARCTVDRLPQMHRIQTVMDLGRKVMEAVPVERREDSEVMGLGELVGSRV